MPIVEALANHGDASYYINYRRDGLFHSMQLMLEGQQRARGTVKRRCCCDWDSETWGAILSKRIDHEGMVNSQRCAVVPSELLRVSKFSNGRCPPVAFSKWVNLDSVKAEFMVWAE